MKGKVFVMKEDLDGNLKKLFSLVILVLVFLLLATYFVAMLLGPLLFFSTADGLSVSRRIIQFLPIRIFGINLTMSVNISVGLFFLSLWLIFLMCFVVASMIREDFFVSLEKIRKGAVVASFRNFLLFMPVVASFSYLCVLLIDWVNEMLGVPVKAPPTPQDGAAEFGEFLRFLSVSYAPIVEEIGFRIIPIGISLVVLIILIKMLSKESLGVGCNFWKSLVVAPFYPDKAKRDCGLKSVDVFGFRGGICVAELSVIVVSSVVFGLAHYPLSGGWGPGKFFSATFVGFVLGMVYLGYGFGAPILVHWFFNYYFNVFYLAQSYFLDSALLLFMISYVNVLLGFLILFVMVYKFVRWFRRKFEKK